MTFISPWAIILISVLASCQKESRQVNVDTTKCDPEKTPEKCKKGNITKTEKPSPDDGDFPSGGDPTPSPSTPPTVTTPPTVDNNTPPTVNPPTPTTNPDVPGGPISPDTAKPDASKPDESLGESLGLILELNPQFLKSAKSPIATLKADAQHKDILSKISKITTSYEGVFTKKAMVPSASPSPGSGTNTPMELGSLKMNVLINFEYDGKKCESKVTVDVSQKQIPVTSKCK